MGIFRQKWLERRMECALHLLNSAVTRCAVLPSTPPSFSAHSEGFGQKLFERSEFFWPL
jgi:hypothetical protein